MKWTALVAVFVLWTSPAFCESAEEMASACRTVAAAKVSATGVALPTDFDSGLCWGAFAALQKAINIVASASPRPNVPFLGICAPETSTRTQLILIFEEFSRRHPERLNADFFFVALDALREAFPCSPARGAKR